MGRSAGPFKGVCTQMWQRAAALVSLLTSCSKCRGCHWWCLHPRRRPFVLHFVSVALSGGVPQVQKRRMRSASAMLRLPHFSLRRTLRRGGPRVRDIIVEKTKHKCGQEHLLMATRYSSLLFTTLPFWSSPLSLPSFTLLRSPTLPPLRAFGLKALMDLPGGGFQTQKVMEALAGKWLNLATVRLRNEAAGLSREWLREKNTSKHMVSVCSLNWINWRPMGNHQGG